MWRRTDRKKLFVGIGLLCFSYFLMDTIVREGVPITFIEILFKYPKAIRQVGESFSFTSCFLDWFYFVLPIAIGIVMIPYWCDELRVGYYKMVKIRSGKKKYIADVVIINHLNAIICLIASYAIFVISVLLIFRRNGVMPELNGEILAGVTYSLVYALWISAILVFVASLSANPYITVTLTFLINYIVYAKDLPIVLLLIMTVIIDVAAVYLMDRRWMQC